MIRGPSVWLDENELLFSVVLSGFYLLLAFLDRTSSNWVCNLSGWNYLDKYANNPIMQGLNDGSWLDED